jgi:dephospho-CoA kinase
MILIGVTGPIASGKTCVCQTFIEMGALLIDLDKMGHEVLEEPSTKVKLIEFFGDDIVDDDGSVDRKRIADLVFPDEMVLKRLEDITHPILIKRLQVRINNLRDSRFPGLVVIDAAMLPKWPDVIGKLDYLVMVQSPKWQRTNRLIQDRGYPPEQAELRIKSQEALFEKIKSKIDYLIKNNGDLLELRTKSVKVWLDIKENGS